MAQEIPEVPGKQLTLPKGLVPFPLFLFLLLSLILLPLPNPNRSSALPSYTALAAVSGPWRLCSPGEKRHQPGQRSPEPHGPL